MAGPSVEFLPGNHAVQRVGVAIRSALIQAQQSVITREFPDAHSLAQRVSDELKLTLNLPDKLKDSPVTDLADLPFAELIDGWAAVLKDNDVPASAIPGHAANLAHWTQLVRAFSDPEGVLEWARNKVISITPDFPHTAADIERGSNAGDVLDPYILAANQALLYGNDFQQAIGATVAHKALMVLEGLMGHMHEEVIGRMRGNIRNPEPRGEQELYDPDMNPFPGADVVQPPAALGEPLRIHQIKSKTGSMNSGGGKRLAEQMRELRMRYAGAEIYAHSLVGNTLRGHRTMGGMRRAEPSLIVTVGEAAFRILTGSPNGPELLLRLYQNAFKLAADETGYTIEEMAAGITQTFLERAERAHEGFLEVLLGDVTGGDTAEQDSRSYVGGRQRRSPN